MTDHTDMLQRLRDLAYDNEARLTGTPMIPLHENTIISVIDAIERLEAENAALREQLRTETMAAAKFAEERDIAEGDIARVVENPAEEGMISNVEIEDLLRRLTLYEDTFADEAHHAISELRADNADLRQAIRTYIAEADNAALLRDAFRYRWLRDAENGVASVEFMQGDGNWSFTCEDSLDAAIDAAMLAGKEKT